MSKPPAFHLTEPKTREHAIQKQVADVLTREIARAGKVSWHGVVWWSVSHENYAGEVPGIRVARGLIAGIPDLFIAYAGRAYFIELKEPIDGALSEPQKSVLAALFAASCQAGVATSFEQVLRLIDGWGIPRKRLVRAA
jgi:hypothetical protein